jgi:hypothetical protein
MKIFELLNQAQAQQPGQNDEDDSQGKFDANKVDQNLQDVANNVDDEQAQPEPQSSQQAKPTELDDQNTKPIDAALLSQIKSLPYSKKYNFKDNDPLNPMQLMAKPVEELTQDQSRVRYKMQLLTMKDQVGLEDNKDMEFCVDLAKVINTILHFKKTNTSAQLAAINPSPPYATMGKSK